MSHQLWDYQSHEPVTTHLMWIRRQMCKLPTICCNLSMLRHLISSIVPAVNTLHKYRQILLPSLSLMFLRISSRKMIISKCSVMTQKSCRQMVEMCQKSTKNWNQKPSSGWKKRRKTGEELKNCLTKTNSCKDIFKKQQSQRRKYQPKIRCSKVSSTYSESTLLCEIL